MKNLIFILSISFVLFGCWPSNDNYLSEEDRNYLKQLKPFPLTDKEKSYKKELEKMGLKNVELQRPFYPEDHTYDVIFYSDTFYNWKMKDSIFKISNEIAMNLYNKILEDRVIFGLGEINVNIFFKSKKNNSHSIKFIQSIPCAWLEKKLGFEIKKYGDNYYGRCNIDTNKDYYNDDFYTRIIVSISGYKREG
ncbi:MAG: hypothetical protein FGM14_15745 [Flavobacteriales bacterium]|nr:hypothetical protein [Flavobacteriales bacterium]